MAHYARLGAKNVVIRVDIIDNDKITTSGGIEKESLAFDHLFSEFGGGIWGKCSYNPVEGVHRDGGTPLRANFPGGQYNETDPWFYDETNDIFCKSRPKDKNDKSCASWTLNVTRGVWEPPIERPLETRDHILENKIYLWDELLYQGDNTKGWVLT